MRWLRWLLIPIALAGALLATFFAVCEDSWCGVSDGARDPFNVAFMTAGGIVAAVAAVLFWRSARRT